MPLLRLLLRIVQLLNYGPAPCSKDRTSTSTSFLKGEDEVIARIEKRISAITHIPVGEHPALPLPLSQSLKKLLGTCGTWLDHPTIPLLKSTQLFSCMYL